MLPWYHTFSKACHICKLAYAHENGTGTVHPSSCSRWLEISIFTGRRNYRKAIDVMVEVVIATVDVLIVTVEAIDSHGEGYRCCYHDVAG